MFTSDLNINTIPHLSNNQLHKDYNFLNKDEHESGYTVDLNRQLDKIENLNIALSSYEEYKNLLSVWSRKIENILEFKTLSKIDKSKLDKLYKDAKHARDSYYNYCYDSIETDEGQVARIDNEVMQIIKTVIPIVMFDVVDNRISSFTLIDEGTVPSPMLDKVLENVIYFDALESADFSNSNIHVAPEVPESVLVYDISKTRVTKLPQISFTPEKLQFSETLVDNIPTESCDKLIYIDAFDTPLLKNEAEIEKLVGIIEKRPNIHTKPNLIKLKIDILISNIL